MSSQHLKWALIGGIPGLLFWVIGIPFVAFILLHEEKQKLLNEDIRLKYGFLYNGYKLKSYYWEVVIMYRKVSIIFISVFLKVVGTKIQAFIAFLLILLFTYINSKKKPYLTIELNQLE